MTLIAFTLRPDGADVVTDSLSYAAEMIDHLMIDKCRVFPQWDTAVTGVGPAELVEGWCERLRLVAPLVQGFDALDELAPEVLPGLWDAIAERENERSIGTVLHVGWSARRGRFAASLFSAAEGFAPMDLTDHALFVEPAALDYVPPRVPASDDDWRTLVEASHEDWTQPGPRNLLGGTVRIGGDVVRTTLSRGHVERRVVHSFPTHGQQWRWSLIGTMSEEGQLGPCSCGSGLPACACHIPNAYADPCPCLSGKTVEHCCAIKPEDARVMPYYLAHLEDYESTRAELAARFRRVNPHLNWPPPEILRLRGWREASAAAARCRTDVVPSRA